MSIPSNMAVVFCVSPKNHPSYIPSSLVIQDPGLMNEFRGKQNWWEDFRNIFKSLYSLRYKFTMDAVKYGNLLEYVKMLQSPMDCSETRTNKQSWINSNFGLYSWTQQIRIVQIYTSLNIIFYKCKGLKFKQSVCLMFTFTDFSASLRYFTGYLNNWQ